MFSEALQVIQSVFVFLKNIWWIWTPYILFLVFWQTWLVYIRGHFLARISWLLLEIKIPKEIGKPPQAMEQIFAGFHGIKGGQNLVEKYWLGKVQLWLSCEIVGKNGAISFFIWTPSQFKNLIEAQVYAQYPESEIREVPDYTNDIPLTIPDSDWELFGTELALTKEDAYPIRTYKEFAIEDVPYESQKVDPLASLAELLASLKDDEEIWIQMLLSPAGDEWKEEGEALVDKLIGRKKAEKKTLFEEILDDLKLYLGYMQIIIWGGEPPEAGGEKNDAKETMIQYLSPGQKDVVAAVERNISKIAFNTAVRMIYLAKREVFNPSRIASLSGIYKQFNTLNLNGFKRANATGVDYFFVKEREIQLKRTMQLKYRLREKPGPALYKFTNADYFFEFISSHTKSAFTFNLEELATIFHFPGGVVSSLSMPRIEAKKGGPPINLPFA